MKPAMPGDHRAIVAWIGRVIQSFPREDPALLPLDGATIRQIHATVRNLPQPQLEGFTKAFRKRFHVPEEATSIADRICQKRHHDWIEAFLVQHQSAAS
jgi:hypothetical protein